MKSLLSFIDSLPWNDIGAASMWGLAITLPVHYYLAVDRWQGWFGGVVGARIALSVVITVCAAIAVAIGFFAPEPSKPVEAAPLTQSQRMLARQGKAYVLEIRNVDLTAQISGGIGMWRRLKTLAQPNRSFFSLLDEKRAFPPDVYSVALTASNMFGHVFRNVASLAVHYWPLPTFIAMPKHDLRKGRPADSIVEGRIAASLGVTLFLWQDDEGTTSTQSMIERLFAFFDSNPDVPEALIVASDGDYVRHLSGAAPGSGNLSGPLDKPSVLHGNAALLVSRSDRVDAYIRPHTALHKRKINRDDKNDDLTKLWYFYHHMNTSPDTDAFRAHYKAEHDTPNHSAHAPTMSATFWQLKLPEFWANRTDKRYIGSPFLPVSWTTEQLEKFDKSPMVGYLHRPVRVPLRDENGVALARQALVANLRAGYERAVLPLEKGRKPTRLFYDTSHDVQWGVAVAEALKNLPDGGPDPTLESDSYDLHYRIGNLGAVSALGQIALATMAGHDDGRVSITLNTGEANGDHADFIVVTPPDEAQIQRNRDTTSSRILLGGF